MSVYQPCDIRGLVSDLSPALYHVWGRILGAQAAQGQTVVIGGDVRTTTPVFLAALGDGLARAGARVVNLGILPTPMIYFAKRHARHRACAVVTASHNPPQFNGLKWMIGDVPPSENDVRELRRRTEALGGEDGSGAPDISGATGSLPASAFTAEQAKVSGSTAAQGTGKQAASGTVSFTSDATSVVASSYIAWLRDHLAAKNHRRPLRLILDPGNGCWSARAAAYLAQVFPDLPTPATIFDSPDGTFPARDPDCAKPQHLTALSQAVVAAGANLGIAFDGDGDRVAFVDDQGVPLTAEQATWLFLQSMAPELAGEPFVYDLKFSDLVPATARQLGAVPHAERSGHAFIRTTMIDRHAAFGAEISGHYFYRDLGFGDDGFYSALRLTDWLSRQPRSLSAWRSACPPIFMTADFRVPVPPADRATIIAHARQAFADLPQTHLDGTRIDFPAGWALVRASVTEPSLTIRFEGRTAAALHDVVTTFCAPMGAVGEKVRALYERGRAKGQGHSQHSGQ